MPRLLIIGPPGSGKGSQAAVVSQRLGIPTISTGEIFRQHVRDATSLGKQVAAIMAAGDYVPDELTNELIKDRLGQRDAAAGFILDGYPRTAAQVEELDRVLTDGGHELDAVVYLELELEPLVSRLLKRGLEQGRADDNEDSIRRRIDVYEEQTAPLLELYRARDIVLAVNGLGSMAEVTNEIMAGLDSRLPTS